MQATLSAKYYGSQAVQKYAVFDVVFDCACQRDRLNVPANSHQICYILGMVDALYHLLDNRPFIQFARDVVRRGADQFYPPLMGFLVRARTLEANGSDRTCM